MWHFRNRIAAIYEGLRSLVHFSECYSVLHLNVLLITYLLLLDIHCVWLPLFVNLKFKNERDQRPVKGHPRERLASIKPFLYNIFLSIYSYFQRLQI